MLPVSVQIASGPVCLPTVPPSYQLLSRGCSVGRYHADHDRALGGVHAAPAFASLRESSLPRLPPRERSLLPACPWHHRWRQSGTARDLDPLATHGDCHRFARACPLVHSPPAPTDPARALA